MYIRTIKFKVNECSDWQKGYYVGEGENSNDSCILDLNYKPVLGQLWDLVNDYANNLEINIPYFGGEQ